jgi:sugar phosphate isomerase/epimerase
MLGGEPFGGPMTAPDVPTIALHSHSFTPALAAGDVELGAVLRFFAELGVVVVEVADAHVQLTGPESVRGMLADLGLEVVCYDVAADFVDPDPTARREELAELRRGLERAAEVGSRYLLTYPGRPKPGVEPAAVRSWFAEALREALPLARRLGITITIPDVGTAAALSGTSDHLNEICDAVGPELRVTYDVGNFLLAGEEPLPALDRLAARVAHVHLKDWRVFPADAAPPPGAFTGLDGRHYLGLALGQGILDLPAVLGRLADLGYAGCLSIEYEGTDDPWQAVRDGLAYLRPLLATWPRPAGPAG